MSQKTINVGTVANDGTGDTIRGAFTNVNANFTEVYNNISSLTATVSGIDATQNTTLSTSFDVANAAFAQANTANTAAYNVGISANLFAINVGASSNAYTVGVGAASNAYTVSVGAASNAYIQNIGAAGNSYTSILSANNAAGANDWANNLTTTTYAWANSKFDTIVNTSMILSMANAAYIRANNSLANTANASNGSITLIGSLVVTGTLTDAYGAIREQYSNTINSNYTAQLTGSVVIANNANTILYKIPDDNLFVIPANTGTSIEIYQYGSGSTKIVANDAAVTVRSSNNWANIAGQYLTAKVVKVLPNTWILTGDLKA
jgi:hypothetical protein